MKSFRNSISIIFLLFSIQLIAQSNESSKKNNSFPTSQNQNNSQYEALTDTSFDSGSKININSLNDEQYNSLYLLGKIWGFLKYYHPTIASGIVNWDYQLFRVLPKYLNITSKNERNIFFVDWIESLGSIERRKEKINYDKNNIKFEPDLEWIENESEFGTDVVNLLKEIKNANRVKKNFYISFMQGVGNPVFEHENRYSKIKSNDDGYRLLALFRYWSIIQYYFPYKNLIKENWNEVLKRFIPVFINSRSEIDYRLTILQLIDLVKDTHANIWGYDSTLNEYLGNNIIPCKITFIENKAVIAEVYHSIDSSLQLKVGDIIESINGESVQNIVDKKLPYYPASNNPTKLRNIARDLLRTDKDSLAISYIRNDIMVEEIVKTIPFLKLASYKPAIRKSWEIINKDIGYIYLGTLKKNEIAEMEKSFKDCKGIIIDIRCYPSDFPLFELGSFLMPKPIPFVKFTSTNYDNPGMFLFGTTLSVGRMNPDYFKGKVVITVNETTQSSAEYHSMAFRKAPKAIVIGSTTAGADGNVSQFYLPGGIMTMISGIGVYYPDGTETQGIGIIPDIEIKSTIKGTIAGKDEVLEKAIEIINNK